MHRCMENKTVLITGATGLIGQALIRKLLSDKDRPAKILALTRNRDRAEDIFSDFEKTDRIEWIEGDVRSLPAIPGRVDFIIHGAAETGSRAFVETPVEVIDTAFSGTRNLLELAREKKPEAFVFLSTMEVYGAPATDEKILETHGTDLDTMKPRSSYPEGKRLCEALCASYAAEYAVPAMVLRLTQTFGPGVLYHDGRVFAEFARCVIEKRDIVLKTKGETKRSYLYTEDAASAILTVLREGRFGEAYNAANEKTYCSIREMAELVAAECAGGEIGVRIEEQDTAAFGYAPVLHMNLDTGKLAALGWKAETGLKDMFINMIEDMRPGLLNNDNQVK